MREIVKGRVPDVVGLIELIISVPLGLIERNLFKREREREKEKERESICVSIIVLG